MPAYRRKKNAARIVSRLPRAPLLTEAEKEEAKVLRLGRKMKKEAKADWEETLKVWTLINGFRWRAGTLVSNHV